MALIEFESVSKTFKSGTAAKLIAGHIKDRLARVDRSVFYALKNVSFRVEPGESLAVIGRNGAGKSTLLGLVAGLCDPNEGRVTVNGRVAALLELGSGFHGDLTGVENLWLNAALLGLSRKRTAEVFDSIVEFAGIGEFIQQPLRTYSTGMVMRLAFAVAIHVDPDILIIDEVLAVGDSTFNRKCYDKLHEFRRMGKTLLFVSHAAAALENLCDRALWLDHGQVMVSGMISFRCTKAGRPCQNSVLPNRVATVVIPTLAAGETLAECLRSLAVQTQPDFEVVVIDNSGKGLVRQGKFPGIDIVEMKQNVGFGAAINAACASSTAPYLATLNDDAVASPQWLAALVAAIELDPEAGSCASQVRLYGEPVLDSAGMLICADGSSKQRGHRRPPSEFATPERVLMPSASAALYRRAMLDQAGAFDGDFFLYCEDTDLGLRAARQGWRCLYVPQAVVEHRYSHSAGRVSPLKAYYVERNRIYVAIKNFPAALLFAAPFVTLLRYWWHLHSLFRGQGSAGQFQGEGNGGWRLAWLVCKAHAAALSRLGRLWKQRRQIAAESRISDAAFTRLIRQFSIPARKVAEL